MIQEPNEPTHELSLRNILPLLSEITKVFLLGVQLNIDLSTLRRIEMEKKDDLERQKAEIIDHWLHNSSDLSWGKLAEAVKRLGGHDLLASKLKELENSPLPQVGSNQPDTGSIASADRMTGFILILIASCREKKGNRFTNISGVTCNFASESTAVVSGSSPECTYAGQVRFPFRGLQRCNIFFNHRNKSRYQAIQCAPVHI